MKTNMNSPSPPHHSIKTRFAAKFLVAMKKLNKNRSPSPSMAERYKRCLAVKAVACASMASTVGPRRAWSRAVLRKMKKHALHHSYLMNKSTRPQRKKAQRAVNPRKNLGFRQEDDLRCLVPGGEGMEFCSLLSETSHYIKCLQAQVQVMTNILDHFSSSNKHNAT